MIWLSIVDSQASDSGGQGGFLVFDQCCSRMQAAETNPRPSAESGALACSWSHVEAIYERVQGWC